MFRLSVVIMGALLVVLAAVPSGNAYVATRGSMDIFNAGGSCLPGGCPPISAAAYQAPCPMPAKIAKCKVPQVCAPMPCPPPPCGPAPCAPACTIWY